MANTADRARVIASNDEEHLDSKICWELVQRVVASKTLRRSARLQEFLLYVGRRSLLENVDKISEHEIGLDVFGRSDSYETSVDNIVRVNATEVRKRTEAYFESEGAHETLIFEIPRGSYKPVFRRRNPRYGSSQSDKLQAQPAVPAKSQAPTADETTVPSAAPSTEIDTRPVAPLVMVSSAQSSAANFDAAPKWKQWNFVVAGLIIGVLAITNVVTWRQNRALTQASYLWRSTPASRSFWSNFFQSDKETDIILSDTSFALYQDMSASKISLKDYLNHKYLDEKTLDKVSPDRRFDLNFVASKNLGSLNEFRLAQHLISLGAQSNRLHLFSARDYPPASVTKDNLILIGSRKANPWDDLFESKLNFVIEQNPDTVRPFIRNREPAKGEQLDYLPDPTVGYTVVAFLPNPANNGNVLIIEGTGSEATEAAGQFVTSEEQLAKLERLLHVDKLPYFEVLLRTSNLNNTPLDSTIEAFRVHTKAQ